MTKIKKQILPTSTRGTGKTYNTRSESDAIYTKNINYLYNIEVKAIEAFSSNAKTFFTLTQDTDDNQKSFDRIFDVLTEHSKNKMLAVSKIQNILQQERIWRKRAELELKEIKNKNKNA